MTTISAHELESAAADTWYIQSSDVTYVDADAGIGTITTHADDQASVMSTRLTSYRLREGFMEFDLSAVPYGSRIKSAVFSFRALAKDTSDPFTMEFFNYNWSSVSTSEWQTAADLVALNAAGKRLATIADTSVSTSTYIDMASDTNAVSLVQAAVDAQTTLGVISTTNLHRTGDIPGNLRKRSVTGWATYPPKLRLYYETLEGETGMMGATL